MRYLVSVAPMVNDSDNASPPQMTMVVEVDSIGTSGVVELTMRAAAGTDLGSWSLPSINFEKLAQAFGCSATDGAPVLPGRPTLGEGARPTARSPRKVRKPAKVNVAAARDGVASPRAYRRMPDMDELRSVYASTGTIVGIAEHYDVPIHTAQGWIGRLRGRAKATSQH